MRFKKNAIRLFWLTSLLNQSNLQDSWTGVTGVATPGSLHLLEYDVLAEIGLTAHMAVLVLGIKDRKAIVCPVFMIGTGLVKLNENDRWLGVHEQAGIQYAHGGLLQIRTSWTAAIPIRKLGLSICRIQLNTLFNRLIDNEQLNEHVTLEWSDMIPSRVLSHEMWRSLTQQLIRRRSAPHSWLTISSPDAPRFVPLFGEHNMNKGPDETGCEMAGSDGLVCCCKRTCPMANGEEPKERFFVCGIKRVERSFSNQGDVGHYRGINSDGGSHHLGEMASGMWPSKRLCQVHNRRRLKKH